jgi:hypothetical protein
MTELNGQFPGQLDIVSIYSKFYWKVIYELLVAICSLNSSLIKLRKSLK